MDYNTDFEMDFEDRIMDTWEIPAYGGEADTPRRPRTLDEYIGQGRGKGT